MITYEGNFSMNKKLNDKQILNKLKINSFAELTEDKMGEFRELLPQMKVEVVEKALEQVPEFVKLGKTMVGEFKELTINGFQEGGKGADAYFKSCNRLLDSLQKELDKPHITERRKEKIIKTMITVTEMIGKKDTEHKGFILKSLGVFASVFALIFGGILTIITLGRVNLLKK